MKSTDILRVENLQMDNKTYIIRWQVTYLCNYYCDFCVQGNKEYHLQRAKGESAQIREMICRKLIILMEEQLNEKAEVIQLYMIGGEVTILKDFLPILSRLLEVKFNGMLEIHITTNLSIDIKTCKKLVIMLKGKKNRRLTLSCSYYKEFTDEKTFFKKIDILTRRNIRQELLKKILHYRANIPKIIIGYPLSQDEDYEQYKQFIQDHMKYVDLIKYIVIRNYKTSISKSVKEKLRSTKEPKKNIKVTLKDGRTEYFDENSHIGLILDNELCFQPNGFLCDIGMRNITIDPQGNMSYCTSATQETMFGNICSDTPCFLKEKMRCPAKACPCSYYSCIENPIQ